MDKRIALVTGASRGIGRAVAIALAQDGWHILLNFQSHAEEMLATNTRTGGSSVYT